MATAEKRFVVETANRCGRLRIRWSFDRLEDAVEYLTKYSSEKRPGKLLDIETGELVKVSGWD
ncbi:hypothetical protein C5S53_13610 [Methanophagales archaeon]|nr:hypothetical protein C5S53_13610 [Methanophagales archaeon]